MLQRAASNAYSWWWASHIRTKQSKWLEQNLQDMGEKVQIMLKLIEEDGDSFAKRAEMYYKKRPELIQFVEESYRAYRALAERYDHLSNELQNANRTIATVFPEQVQFSMDEEDEDANSRLPKKISSAFIPKDIPKAPKELVKDPKAFISSASKRLQTKKATNSLSTIRAPKSGLSKPQALEEIDELQKEILGLQTEKEFVKSSYENGLVKYWEIEEQIMEKHERICKLQDEFGAGPMIEDDVARSLMAEAAIKSCHETLAELQEKQGKTAQDAKIESKRIIDFWEKLSSLKNEIPHSQINQEKSVTQDENVKARDNLRNLEEEEESCATQVRKDLELLREKVSEQFESGSNTSLSVTEMAEKVDEIVDKVMNLESAVSSHEALVKRLRAENDDLQTKIRNLEDDKESLISDAGEKRKKLTEMKEKFDGIQELNKNIESKSNSLQVNFTEAQCTLEHLSEKLHDVKPDEEVELTSSSQQEERSAAKIKIIKNRAKEEEHDLDVGFNKHESLNAEKEPEIVVASEEVELNSEEKLKGQDNAVIPVRAGQDLQNGSPDTKLMQVNSFAKEEGSVVEVISKEESQKQEMSDHVHGFGGEDILAASSTGQGEKGTRQAAKEHHEDLSNCEEQKVQDTTDEKVPSRTSDIILDTQAKKEAVVKEDEPDCRNLLNEYTTVLRNYKVVKKKLDEVEKKDDDNLIDKQIRELRSANALKDEEIRSLHQKLSLMQRLLDENKDAKEENISVSQQQTNVLDVNLYTLLTSTPASTSRGEESKGIKVTSAYQPQSNSPVEEKFRMSMDELLEQNLDFWLRFSTSFAKFRSLNQKCEICRQSYQKWRNG